jgi:hypothetical protein
LVWDAGLRYASITILLLKTVNRLPFMFHRYGKTPQ